MNLQNDNLKFFDNGPLSSLFAALNSSPDRSFTGLSGMAAPLALAALAQRQRVTLLITSSAERAGRLVEETRTWLGSDARRITEFLPDRNSIYDQTAVNPQIVRKRLASLTMELSGGGVVVAPIAAAAERFFAPAAWRSGVISLAPGSVIRPSELALRLVSLGYKRTNIVEEPGEFAVRGGIFDVFSPHADMPVRLDFFGDEIESLKSFSCETQRTIEKLDAAVFVPVLEYPLEGALKASVAKAVEEHSASLDSTKSELLQRRLERFCESADSRDVRELVPFLAPGQSFLWDFWHDVDIFLEDIDQLQEELNNFLEDLKLRFKAVSHLTPLLAPEAYYHDSTAVLSELSERKAGVFSRFKRSSASNVFLDIEPLSPPTDPSRESLLKDIQRYIKENWAVAIVINDTDRYHNLRGLLGERGISIFAPRFPWQLARGKVVMLEGAGLRGFVSHSARVVVMGEEDIYSSHVVKTASRRHATADKTQAFVSQLVPGDLVVHSEHGIAEYRGIQTMTAAGVTREYLMLQYAGADKLYVPIDQVHKVQKYIGMEGARPVIHSLNSKVWESQKRRVQKNVELIAKELLELYAKRHAESGFAFPPDNELQRQMEERFAYVETPDQAKAIEAVKKDMEAEAPMDRLVCGDVGYGKTEVALRAAFKAVCAGKQVAVLAPTTLLAFQHHRTFLKRFEGFPVSVGLVCRLRKPAEQKETLAKTAAGRIDILIGTHRLLSSDVRFKDLGLLIVDEEQRFGVKHKEKIKQLKSSVDVLTLAATPIPRTLQMALSGIRQISIIDTPPEQRRPVQTYVAPFDSSWAKRAVIDELKRGGQIFYVYNRVEKIEQKAAFLRELVPEARLAVAHGQMPEGEVERTMIAFLRGEFDLLLASTIIESGLDIPNVNTLIVDEAERLGLSQMYQLRGRVGRSSRQAFAFFFYSKGKRLTREAAERLATIEEHTALGSGFKIAMRDLQIRGAGNILGEEQSGHIAAVGFALYIELLEEAVQRLRGAKVEKLPDVTIEIPISALFPAAYMPDEETRIEMYARLAKASDENLLNFLREEIVDRFGPIPIEGERLFSVTKIRLAAARAGVCKISSLPNRLRFEFADGKRPPVNLLLDSSSSFYKRLLFTPSDPQAVFVQCSANSDVETTLELVEQFLTAVSASRSQADGKVETLDSKTKSIGCDNKYELVSAKIETAENHRIAFAPAGTVRISRAGKMRGEKKQTF